MKRRDDVQRLLRWYPASWRTRYGDEFVALLEDRFEESPPTLRQRASIAVAGVRQRGFSSGLIGARSTASTQRRSGSLTVLVAWSIMVIGGAGLVKTGEHFRGALPSGSRFAAQFSYDAAAVAGIVGTLLVLAGALVALPGLVRLIREEGWRSVEVAFRSPVIASLILASLTIGLSSWAHTLNTAQRNGGDRWYSVAFVAIALLAAVAVGLWATAGVAVATRIDFSERALRWESWLAMSVCISAFLVIAGAVAWWIEMALQAPSFLGGTVRDALVTSLSPQLVGALGLMVVGTCTASWGAWRVALTFRRIR